jgi:pilus assembly protein CpaB
MRSKSMFLMIACVCGAIAAVGASQLMQAQGTGTAVAETTEILVATRVINAAEEIKPEMIALETWPSDKVPSGATTDLAKLEGKFAAQKIYAGEPIINEKLISEGMDMTVAIPAGYSVVSMKADGASSVANLVQPGDRVNVMAYFTKSDMIPETGVRTILTGVKVFAVDGRTARDPNVANATVASTVSLLIEKEDEEAWTFASELGRIRLSLGRPSESGAHEAAESGGQAFLKWMADYQAEQTKKSQSEKLALAPVEAAPNANASKKATGFKMLKLHGGEWTEYEFVDGKQAPVIKAQSSAGDAVSSDSEQVAEAPNEYSYLNGSQSPFYEPTKAAAGLPLPGESKSGLPLPKGAVSGIDGF